MSVSSVTSSPLFSKDLYTVYVNGAPYDSAQDYGIDAVYTVTLNYTVDEIPLALLFAAMQIGLADIASYQAESYMQQIRDNQEAQIAAKQAIAEANKFKEMNSPTLDAFIAENPTFEKITNLTVDDFSFDYALPTGKTDSDNEGLDSHMESKIIDALKTSLLTENPSTYAVEVSYVTCSKTPRQLVIEGEETWIKAQGSRTDTRTDIYEYRIFLTILADSGEKFSTTYACDASCKEEIEMAGWLGDGWWEAGDRSYTPSVTNDSLSDLIPNGVMAMNLTADFVKLCASLGITEIDGIPLSTSVMLTDAQLDDLIDELELKLETVSSTLQTDMLYAEEYLGQFNSYLSGGSSSIDELNTTLQSIAQRI